MVIGFKGRLWSSFLAVSAGGPEYSLDFEAADRLFRPRMAADLRHTKADADYFASHWQEPNYDSGVFENHARLADPGVAEFMTELGNVALWMAPHRVHSAWDGGSFQLTFAGHGREGDGALVLHDGVVSPIAFLDALDRIASQVSSPGRLRVSLLLDSCHSGAFLTQVLASTLTDYSSRLVPWNLAAACMHDEFAYEDSSLGHGIYTYCSSVRSHSLGSQGALAVQANNAMGSSLSLAFGVSGCALITAGRQNPVEYYNGARHLGVCYRDFSVLSDSDTCMDVSEMRARLTKIRDEYSAVVAQLRPGFTGAVHLSDDDMRRSIREDLEFIRAHQLRAPGESRAGVGRPP